MVMAHKAESKIEEVKDRVWARSAVTTEVVEGSKEPSNQIAKLMAVCDMALYPDDTLMLKWYNNNYSLYVI